MTRNTNFFRLFLYGTFILLMGSLGGLVDAVYEDQPFFSSKRQIVIGGVNTFVAFLLLFGIEVYMRRLERALSVRKKREQELEQTTVQLQQMYSDQKKAQQYLKHVINSSLDIIITVNREREIVEFNRAAEEAFGYAAAEVLGKHIEFLYHDNEEGKTIHDTILSTGKYLGEVTNRKRDGSVFPAFLSASSLRDDENTFLGIMGISRDITEIKRAEQALRRAATLDRLTGIFNRHTFEEALEREVERMNRYKRPMALIMFDIDHFKLVNDNYGHHAGDLVLKTVAAVVIDNLRKIDNCGRWGGEEFMVLLPESCLADAATVAGKLRHLIEMCSYGDMPGVTASFGIVELREHESAHALCKRVDSALYRAKQNGRNRVEIDE